MGKQKVENQRSVLGVVFDLDGTLVSQELDFAAIRAEIGLPIGQPLLEAIGQMTGEAKLRATDILDRRERIAAASAQILPGVRGFVDWLARKNVRQAVLSRNSRRSVEQVLIRCGLKFDPIVAREDAPHKPDPSGILQICRTWGIEPHRTMMIGDYLFDLEAGRRAGTRTALITHGRQLPFAHLADVTFPSFCDLPELLQGMFESVHNID
jgi:HAD superfamily hydrolase (TIGR01509 family)